MIVKFFKRGDMKSQKTSSGGKGAKDYLLGKGYERGKIRQGAKLIKGDPSQTTEIINGLTSNKIYTSGCLSFTAEESLKINDTLKKTLMNSFEQCLFPEFDCSRTSSYWVEHQDKGRLELNFVFANVDLKTGNALTVYLHKLDKNRIDCWKDLMNTKYALSDPHSANRKRLTQISNRLPESIKQLKIEVNDLLNETFLNGKLNNRQNVIDIFNSLNFKIVRQSKNSISIKNPLDIDSPNIRFQGAYYEQKFNSTEHIATAETTDESTETDKRKRIEELSAEYARQCRKRAERLHARYSTNALQTKSANDNRDETVSFISNEINSTIENSINRANRKHSVSATRYESTTYSANHSSKRNAENSNDGDDSDITSDSFVVDSDSIQATAIDNCDSRTFSNNFWRDFLRSLSTPYQPRNSRRGVNNESDRTFKDSFDTNRERNKKSGEYISNDNRANEFEEMANIREAISKLYQRQRFSTDKALEWIRAITDDYRQTESRNSEFDKTNKRFATSIRRTKRLNRDFDETTAEFTYFDGQLNAAIEKFTLMNEKHIKAVNESREKEMTANIVSKSVAETTSSKSNRPRLRFR